MDANDYEAQFFIFENRLNSFQVPQTVSRRRNSTAANSRVPKVLTWPHQSPSAFDLARAGFFFNPHPSNPDNVKCFLCNKDLDGWEEDDDPLQEHLKHSGSCGWATCAAIERELGDVVHEDPRLPYLIEARKATFAGRWPYESKKGWKCKTKQLAEAGWQYTPTLESDDNTTCAYCQLALDGWEAGDKPMEEHQKRSPNCPFFILISTLPAPKKAARGRGARASKASRLSVQSVATTVSEAPSTADVEESFMTTTSAATHGGRKAPRARKAAGASTTGRARKTRMKKDEPIEILSDADADPIQDVEPLPAKPARGKKRGSNEMDTTNTSYAEAPTKKRATRERASSNMHDDSVQLLSSRYAMFDPTVPETNEEAIDAELQALEKDMAIEAPAEPEIQVPKKGRKAGTRKVSKQVRKGKEVAAAPAHAQPEAYDETQSELMPEPELQSQPQPTVKSKAKASGRGKKAVQAAQKDAESTDEPHDVSIVSIASSHTMMLESAEAPAPKRKRGRPSKQSLEAQANALKAQKTAAAAAMSVTITPMPTAHRLSMASVTSPDQLVEDEASVVVEEKQKKRPQTRILPPPIPTIRTVYSQPQPQTQPQPQQQQRLAAPPMTPRANRTSPAASARQAVLSPSQSPQSSDAENRPPSTKQAANATKGHVMLPPVQPAAVSTPVRTGSPSKRNNMLGGLRSTIPWTEVDVDAVFDELEKDNGSSIVESLLLRQGTDLSTPEKAMTVEEFIFHNAGQAERHLKDKCEAMVSMFEQQGTQAMQTLEALVAEE